MFADGRWLLVPVMLSADCAAQQGCLRILYTSAVIQAGCEAVCAEVQRPRRLKVVHLGRRNLSKETLAIRRCRSWLERATAVSDTAELLCA